MPFDLGDTKYVYQKKITISFVAKSNITSYCSLSITLPYNPSHSIYAKATYADTIQTATFIWVQWWRYLKRAIYSIKRRSCNKMHYSTALPSQRTHPHTRSPHQLLYMVIIIHHFLCCRLSITLPYLPCLVKNRDNTVEYVVSELSQGKLFTFCHMKHTKHHLLM